MWYEGNDETEVKIIDEQSFPNMTVNAPASVAEGDTLDVTFSFDQVFEKTEILNYRVYWDFDDHQYWQWFGGAWVLDGGVNVCGTGDWEPPSPDGLLLESGSLTLTPTGTHDFIRSLTSPIPNGMHDPARFLRIVFEWENEELLYDPSPFEASLIDDTAEPTIVSFEFNPDTLYESWANLPSNRSDTGANGTVTLSSASSIPLQIDLTIDGALSTAGALDVVLPGISSWQANSLRVNIGATSTQEHFSAKQDHIEGDEAVAVRATASWNASSAVATATIIDSPFDGNSGLPRLLEGTLEIPDSLGTGAPIGSMYLGENIGSVGYVIDTIDGPFSIASDGLITYNGSQSLDIGESYSITAHLASPWEDVSTVIDIDIVAANGTATEPDGRFRVVTSNAYIRELQPYFRGYAPRPGWPSVFGLVDELGYSYEVSTPSSPASGGV